MPGPKSAAMRALTGKESSRNRWRYRTDCANVGSDLL
jgi:hypothetical protein